MRFIRYSVLLSMLGFALYLAGLSLRPLSLEEKKIEARLAFDRISNVVVSDFSYFTEFEITDKPEPNAYASLVLGGVKPPLRQLVLGYKIQITIPLLEALRNKHEIAAIIGHEYAHIMLGHLNGKRWDQTILNEINSDKLGVYLMLAAGYDVCKAKDYWARQAAGKVGASRGTTHPLNLLRARYLSLPGC